ncbi:MAG: ATP-binding cassette domain-containing protein [Alphaproteobacteria bacterium]|jgi:phospholipid/cholesterol/gamma-HCH transport system ATP-binding protein|nr:ATP-binding cassette domain-containing protein [Alphaproteobacteria bacterium]MDP6813385.1 ATP-binding cassette domain-containing protein [Alphaproteobacteria bacterium]
MIEVPRLQLSGVCKAFGANVVLDGLDLELAKGESVVVIGASGTGKSVMLKCILGLLRPERGSIRIDGEEVVGLRGAERERVLTKFGMLFQSAALFDSISIWENVAFGLIEGAGMDPEQARAIAIDKLAKVGLGADMAEQDPARLSGGMRKRVGLARAIATEPDIIFFDEPTTGLDPIMGDVINNLIVECVRDLGATTLTITHDMSSARTIADRVAMLYGGQIIWAGRVDEIDSCGNPFVDQFIHGREEGPFELEVT